MRQIGRLQEVKNNGKLWYYKDKTWPKSRMRGDRSREVLINEYWLGKEVSWVGGRFLWEVVAHERPNHWALTGKRSLGGWSHLVRSGRLQEVLIIEHWLDKKFSRQVVASYGRFDCILSLRVTMLFSNFDWFFFLFQLIISLFFVPRLFLSFCLLRKYTLSDLFTTVQGVTSAIMMGVMWE